MAVAATRSIAYQQQLTVACYGLLLRSCFGTLMSLQFPRLSAVAELLRKGGFTPSWSSTVAVHFLRGPQLLRAVPEQQCCRPFIPGQPNLGIAE
jgi:hypothetical protein